jgi:Tfp pilus assembly protein PilX
MNLRRIVRCEGGFAMQWVVLLTSIMTLLSVTTLELVRSESASSSNARQKGAVFQAAEAGLDDFLAKLVDDKTYYFRSVHPAESTRHPTSGANVDPLSGGCTVDSGGTKVDTATSAPLSAAVWTGSITWTYPNGKDNWCTLDLNGRDYQYNLQITPPSASNLSIRVVATGRPVGSTNVADWRAIEEWVQFSLVSDFQMITSVDYVVGSTATTNGKIYSSQDIQHSGTATADVFAEGDVNPSCCGSFNLVAPAQEYDHTDIRSVIKTPIDFNTFTGALDDIKRASQAAGTYLDATPAAWKVVFQAGGTFTKQACSLTGGDDPAETAPTCGAVQGPYAVPTNGAIFSEKTVVVSGVVNGRVTLASQFDIDIGDTISYQTIGDDVLGLIGKDDVIVAQYVPYDLTWRAAVIAQNGARHSYDSAGDHGTANHYGSTASKLKPFMDMFDVRNYYYDPTLQYLPPPWFPVLDEAYTVNMFREVAP